MVNCEICNNKYKNLQGLSFHIAKIHKDITIEEYYLKFIGGQYYCECGKKTKFKNLIKGYNKHCSISCMNKSEEHITKVQESNLRKYGIKNVFQLEEIKNKSKETLLKKYGVSHNSYNPETVEKRKKTCLKNYGVTSPLKSEKCKEKFKNTMMSRYGVKNPTQSKKMRRKTEKTNLRKYGVKNVFQSEQIKEKINITRRKMMFEKLITSDRLKSLCVPHFDISEYDGVDEGRQYFWRCIKCNSIFQDHIDNGRVPRCYHCFPKIKGRSNIEKEIEIFCRQYFSNITKHNRTILNGKELDIYLPDIRLGIEINGIFWHSEIAGKKSRNYHFEKTKLAKEKGVTLIHIFEDEWINKSDIIRSILLNKFGKIKIRISGRSCEIKKVESKLAKSFLNENHIQEYIGGINFGLFHENLLVSILTIGRPRYNSEYDYEILRFCNKKNIIVNGGLSKLIKHTIREYSGTFITYSDVRFGDGKGYLNCGFSLKGYSKPNYYYVNNKHIKRLSRLNFQKHKLSKILATYDGNLSEWENMQLNGYDRIWNCGNYIYELKS